jgi:hypothetical protein
MFTEALPGNRLQTPLFLLLRGTDNTETTASSIVE